MIPSRIIFVFWDGRDGQPPSLSFPSGEDNMIAFENRWEVDSFIEKIRFFQEEAFGKKRSEN